MTDSLQPVSNCLILGFVSGVKEQLRNLMPCMELERNHLQKRRISSKATNISYVCGVLQLADC